MLKDAIITILVLISPDTSILFYIKPNNLDFITKAILSQVLKEDSK